MDGKWGIIRREASGRRKGREVGEKRGWNSRFARCRHLTTTTRIPFDFSFLFKSQRGLNNNCSN